MNRIHSESEQKGLTGDKKARKKAKDASKKIQELIKQKKQLSVGLEDGNCFPSKSIKIKG